MIQTRRGQPMRLVGPGNDPGEARVSLKRSEIARFLGLLGPFDAGAEAVRIAGRPNLLASFPNVRRNQDPCPVQRCSVLG
jgi:hypothetical protein